jgi:hypothetical protein
LRRCACFWRARRANENFNLTNAGKFANIKTWIFPLSPFGDKPPLPIQGASFGGLLVEMVGGRITKSDKANIKLSEKKFVGANFFCF